GCIFLIPSALQDWHRSWVRAVNGAKRCGKMQQMSWAENPTVVLQLPAFRWRMTRKLPHLFVMVATACLAAALTAQDRAAAPVHKTKTTAEAQEMIDRVVANQKRNDRAMDLYERIERVEVRKTGSDPQPSAVRTARVIPAGTGTGKAPVGEDGK